MLIRDLVRGWYVRRLRAQIGDGPVPSHVGLIMDGNRRWAREMGMANPSVGHRVGAEHVEDVLSWCAAAGIRHVTVFLCSTENLTRRGSAEVDFLLRVVEEVVAERLCRPEPVWQVHIAGLLDVLPDRTARVLKDAVAVTRHCTTGAHVNLAVGYGGRQEVVDAVRELLHDNASAGTSLGGLAESVTMDDITSRLHTAGQPDPELVIRTSGEQRMSNFLLWQSAHSELMFCDAYWPAFREVDFLRALRGFATRVRRHGLRAGRRVQSSRPRPR